ncbi:two-pore potassium channel 1 [Salvia miltiorrhiza]|uniref:two-pore potassium channel 1 n=1 Tax=Salvia miltiorrhiza TaxID=226208 RepID=UPI0025AD7E37|nr:two-pore potassium channel 1 [Salvia miltiorrhiza]XP_057765078.1 two-pore potassium channel 1 [Salvia miltiorrhiza]
MAKNEAEDPLLEEAVGSSLRSSRSNALMKRRYRHSKSVSPAEQNLQLQHPDSITDNKLDPKLVLLILLSYITAGALCFFLVRYQIKGNKTNGVIDAIYLCVVTMTTVGYGDLVPDSTMSKLLACIFVFVGMALVGLLLSKAVDDIVENQEVFLVRVMHLRDKCEMLKEVETNKVKYKFLTVLIALAMFMIAGTLFLYQKEGLDFFDAVYCVCSTITTLGYGDKSFSTAGGRVFASFWILMSTICLAQFFYSLAELYTERRRKLLVRWVMSRKLTPSDLEAADLDHDKAVSAAEFVVYKLKEMGKICEEDVAMVMEWFKILDVDHSGTLTKTDIPSTS